MQTIKKLDDNIYCISNKQSDIKLGVNTYLIIEKNKGILIDPGSLLFSEEILRAIEELIGIVNIEYVILNSQDPDSCSALRLYEENGLKARYVTHWRTAQIIEHYSIKNDFYFINYNDFKLQTSTERVLKFFHIPYMPYASSFLTYDVKSGTVFSADLFSSFTDNEIKNDMNLSDYIKAYHEHLFPDTKLKEYTIDLLKGINIRRIAPKHGLYIENDLEKYIDNLLDTSLGSFSKKVIIKKIELENYEPVCTLVLKKYIEIYGIFEMKKILGDDLKINWDLLEFQIKPDESRKLWEDLFIKITAVKGIESLALMEPYLEGIEELYDFEYPEILKSSIYGSMKKIKELKEENKFLEKISDAFENILNKNIEETQERLTKNPITKLFNEKFFISFSENRYRDFEYDNTEKDHSVLFLSVDNLQEINNHHGNENGDEVLRSIGYVLRELQSESDVIFKLKGSLFSYFLDSKGFKDSILFAEKVRNKILGNQALFIEPVKISIGIVLFSEMKKIDVDVNDFFNSLYNVGIRRLKIAKNNGDNNICFESSLKDFNEALGKILVVDSDKMNREYIKNNLINNNYEVIECENGEDAMNAISSQPISLVISELMIPKMDGFMLRERMLESSVYQNIPFVMLSHKKDESIIKRTFALNIDNFLKKPFMMDELIGFVNRIIRIEGEHL